MKALTSRDREKVRYEQIKEKLFSQKAQRNGTYNQIPRSFCLADEYSYENLYQDVRDSSITYFLIRGIPWHDGLKGRHLPSNHLCCSQSCCVNFLFPLVKRPEFIKTIFSHYYPEMDMPLPITEDKPLTDGTQGIIEYIPVLAQSISSRSPYRPWLAYSRYIWFYRLEDSESTEGIVLQG